MEYKYCVNLEHTPGVSRDEIPSRSDRNAVSYFPFRAVPSIFFFFVDAVTVFPSSTFSLSREKKETLFLFFFYIYDATC